MTSPTPPPEPDAGHIPLTEEFDSFKHTMPNAMPIVIAMVLVAVILATLAFFLRARPVAAGSIDDAFAVTLPGQNSSLAAVTLSFQNVSEKPLRLIDINIAVHAKGSNFSDDFASVADIPRYFEALPALEQHATRSLVRDTKLAPTEKTSGSVIVSFPLTQEEFNSRDSLTATLTFADHPPVKITSGKKQ